MRALLGQTWPLIGRTSETRSIVEALDDGRGLVLVGEAGVGKTRLLNETATVLAERKYDVISVSGVQAAASIPLAPLLGIVDLRLEGDVTRLILNELIRRSEAGPVAIVVDDVQLLDDASALVIHRVACSGTALVVAALRDGETPPPTIEALWKDEVLDRVRVDALTRRDQDLLIESVLGEVDHDSLAWLWDVAAGHVLYLRELVVDALLAERTETREEGLAIRRPERLPGTIRDAITHRQQRLSSRARRLLDSVAICRTVSLAAARCISTSEAISELDSAGFVDLHQGVLSIAHPVFAEVAAEAIDDEYRRLLASELAEAYDGENSDADDRFHATLLKLDAGLPLANDALLGAAEYAVLHRRGSLAMRLCEACDQHALSDARHVACHAEAAAISGLGERAASLYAQAAEIASHQGGDPGNFYLQSILTAFNYSGPAAAAELVKNLKPNMIGLPRDVAEAVELRMAIFTDPTVQVLERLVQLGASTADPQIRALIDLPLAACCWQLVQPARVESILGEYEANPWATQLDAMRSRQVRANARAWLHPINASLTWLDDQIADAKRSGNADHAPVLVMGKVGILLSVGRAGEALALEHDLEELERLTSSTLHRVMAPGEFAFLRTSMTGDTTELESLLAEIDGLDPIERRRCGGLLHIAASRVARRTGGPHRELWEEGMRMTQEHSNVIHECLGWREQSLFGFADRSCVRRLDEISREAGGGLAALMAREAKASQAHDAGGFEALAEGAEAFGALGLARDAAAGAVSLFTEQDEPAAAYRALQTFRALDARLPGVRCFPAERMPTVLSPRETEVADLVAVGHSNSEVAKRLFIATRTVDHHVASVFRKLDVHRREDVAMLYAPSLAELSHNS